MFAVRTCKIESYFDEKHRPLVAGWWNWKDGAKMCFENSRKIAWNFIATANSWEKILLIKWQWEIDVWLQRDVDAENDIFKLEHFEFPHGFIALFLFCQNIQCVYLITCRKYVIRKMNIDVGVETQKDTMGLFNMSHALKMLLNSRLS